MKRAVSATARCAVQARRLHVQQQTSSSSPVQITTLPNRVRVATEAVPGHFAGVGLYVDAGSRYETQGNSGVSHFLDRMAFKASEVFSTASSGCLRLASRVRLRVQTWKCLLQSTSLVVKYSARRQEKLLCTNPHTFKMPRR